MTDYNSLKIKLWNDARSDKWDEFDKDFQELVENAIKDSGEETPIKGMDCHGKY